MTPGKAALLGAAAAVLTVAFVACGSSERKATTTPAGGKTTAAATATKPAATATAGTTATAAASESPEATGTASTSETPSAGGTTLTLVAKNTLFDKTELEAPAGVIHFVLDNQDPGVAHNLEIYKGEDETGEKMGGTEIQNGPVKETLTLTLEKGDYFFWCVVHPATMSGKLVVK